jgi:4-hydroxy-3-methylbut-2-en-1-yl diphosphate reductase
MLLLAVPRGFCAGVIRAIEAVERALELYGPPVYVRHEIVHNRHVLDRLVRRGAIFVDDEKDVPEGARILFSAHGVSPRVRAGAAARGLSPIDATCPLVTKVHVEVRRFAADGYTVALIGHAGHPETVGTMGEAPEAVRLVETENDVATLAVRDPERVAFVCQTTLSADETGAIVAALRRRFPAIVAPKTEDLCYATTNRQAAVKALARRTPLVLVIGSRNSSNSQRLVETARLAGAAAELIEDAEHIDPGWVRAVPAVGVTAGASAPEDLALGVVDWFRARGPVVVEELAVLRESVRFMLPRELRHAT